MALMEARDLCLGYDGHAVVQGLSFRVERGDYLCIVGENGAGKSTLMKTLLGLIPPISGTLSIGDGLKKREIGYLSQQTPVQRDFPASVEEIVLSGLEGKRGLRPFYNRKERDAALRNMEKMNILNLRKRCYRELSGGQQQRVLLARALCATETLLLLDEPVSGLDPKVTADMYEKIRELNQKDGITIIMISHDMSAALREADHILHIGQSLFFGTTEAYKQSDALRTFGGGR